MKGLKDERIIIMKKTMKRVLALVLAALAIAAAFAGCSGKANNDANTFNGFSSRSKNGSTFSISSDDGAR